MAGPLPSYWINLISAIDRQSSGTMSNYGNLQLRLWEILQLVLKLNQLGPYIRLILWRTNSKRFLPLQEATSLKVIIAKIYVLIILM